MRYPGTPIVGYEAKVAQAKVLCELDDIVGHLALRVFDVALCSLWLGRSAVPPQVGHDDGEASCDELVCDLVVDVTGLRVAASPAGSSNQVHTSK